MAEPGFEIFRDDETNGNSKKNENNFIGFNVPFQIQAMFSDNPVKPFFALGYIYTDIWTKTNDTTFSFRNHSLSIEGGANIKNSELFTIEPFLGYSFALSPKLYLKGGILGNYEFSQDYYRKLRAGVRFFYSVAEWFDIGAGAAYTMLFMKTNLIDTTTIDSGVQLNIVLRKSFSF